MTRFLRLLQWFVILWAALRGAQAEGGSLPPPRFHPVGIEVQWLWDGAPVSFGTAAEGSELRLARADWIMSGPSLLREDGTWLESADWFASFHGGEGRSRAVMEGVPARNYQGMRFQIGVDAATDRADPHQWPPEHPLNPLRNGLHWGWQGGYIYMALEGHYPRVDGRPNSGGFSYHLAGTPQRMTVELKGPLDLTTGGTIRLNFDLARVLAGLDPATFGEFTHSRDGDEVAPRLKARVEQAFSLGGVLPELYQEPVRPHQPKASAVNGTPWPLQISRRLPQVTLPSGNAPTLEGVALGKRLFHEGRLSRTGQQSCASCHQQSAAFTDPGQRFSLGAGGLQGTRNAMPLFNLAWQQEFFWDGRAKRLHEQVLQPITDPLEMHESLDRAVEKLSADPAWPEAFDRAFGSAEITAGRIGLALEQFLLTLISQDSKFDRALLGKASLTPQEQRGLELFVTEHDPVRNLRGADCFHCHSGGLLSNQGFANNGLDAAPAPGRGAVTGRAADHGKFRVPSLRNIALTAPYMHDGRFSSLTEVIDHYDHGVQRSQTLDPNLAKHPAKGLQLSREDKAALVAFLHTLTDPTFAGTAPAPAVLSLSKP